MPKGQDRLREWKERPVPSLLGYDMRYNFQLFQSYYVYTGVLEKNRYSEIIFIIRKSSSDLTGSLFHM